MISASVSEVISLLKKWKSGQASIRVIADLKSGSFSSDCSVLTVKETEVGLRLSGQSKGIFSIRLDGCEFWFGAEDVPTAEIEAGLRFDVGVTILTSDAESFRLLEQL